MRVLEDNVPKFYDYIADREASRLARDSYHMLEYEITMHYLAKYLPPGGHLLDIGGGSGRYCVGLAKKGYRVTLADISEKLLSIARAEFEKAGIEHRVMGIYAADARDLAMFEDETFDGVLALGPIYHIVEEKDRSQAMNEIVRVTREGSPVFISGISLFGVYKKLLISPRYEHEFTDEDYVEMLEKGAHRAKWHQDPSAFPDAWFCTPRQLRELAEDHGLETLDMAACEGLSSHQKEATERLRKNKEAWKVWMDLLIRTSNEPSIIGSSEHILYIGQKKTPDPF